MKMENKPTCEERLKAPPPCGKDMKEMAPYAMCLARELKAKGMPWRDSLRGGWKELKQKCEIPR